MTRGTYFQLFSGVGLRLTLWLYRVRILCSCHNFKKERFLPYFLLQFDPWRLKFGSVCSQRLALSSWRRVILHSVRLLEEYCYSLPLSPWGCSSCPCFSSAVTGLKYRHWGCLLEHLPWRGARSSFQGGFSMHDTGGHCSWDTCMVPYYLFELHSFPWMWPNLEIMRGKCYFFKIYFSWKTRGH